MSCSAWTWIVGADCLPAATRRVDRSWYARQRARVSNQPRICCELLSSRAKWIEAPEIKSWQTPDPSPMYITDLTYFLDKSGAIGPIKGPARAMAQFVVDVVAHASDSTSDALAAPMCFKCKKGSVEAIRALDDALVWACPACRTEGRISNWQGSLWDLRDRPTNHG